MANLPTGVSTLLKPIKKHSVVLLPAILFLYGLLSAKQYINNGVLIYKKWGQDPGLVMHGWQAICVIVSMIAIGLYGLLFYIWQHKRDS